MTAATSKTSPTAHITKTEFWNTLMEDVFGIRKGGAIIFLDAENARKGVAKTSGAVALARLFARAFRYDIQFEDLTLSGTEYLRRYQEHPGQEQPSVLVLDEFVGAGAGDKRRAMAQQNVDFGRAWQLLRTKRVITIATLPDWNEADKRLKKLADYRIWCRERPIGTFQPYKITVPFNADGSGGVRTKGLNRTGDGARRIQFPNMDAQNDPYYTHLSEKKDELIHSETWDADHLHDEESAETSDPEEVRRSEAIRYAIRLYEPWNDENDTTYTDVAKVVEGYQKSWVGDRVKEWREGEHRELVPDPTKK
ncbi:ATP-binding protein [Halovenus salina]|uniref:ATP-binding protein n=1 Tax=Halovenus salina TaxID=1510225 RepID=A0ABD5WAS9_9EURY